MKNKKLSESQEIMLSKFFDGEASLLERIQVQWLVDRNNNAVTYLEKLEDTRVAFRKFIDSEAVSTESSMWARVSAKIHQETRKPVADYSWSTAVKETFDSFFPMPLRYGMGGALLAVSVMTFLSFNSNQTQTATFVNSDLIERDSLSSRIVNTQNVEWFRSNGTVEHFRNQSNRSPVVLIRRRAMQPQNRQLPASQLQSIETNSLPLLAERNSVGIIMKGE